MSYISNKGSPAAFHDLKVIAAVVLRNGGVGVAWNHQVG